MAIKNPRGTRDFGPDEMAFRQTVADKMHTVFSRAAFQPVQTPTFEELELFTAKSGEGIVSELYAFEDKGGRQLTLRPELTAPVMRFYQSAFTHAPKPLKLYYFGNCFRYDRPQKGRYREFWQMGCELIGSDTPEAIAEVLATGVGLIRAAGVQSLVVRVGHIRLLQALISMVGVAARRDDGGALMRAIDKWDAALIEQSLRGAGANEAQVAWFLGLRDIEDVAALRSALDACPSNSEGAPQAGSGTEAARAALDELEAVIVAADCLGTPADLLRVDPMIARGLDYYTGVVFEIDAPALGAEKQLLGGGVYDLSGVFGAEPVGSIGFGLGFDRTLVAIEAEGAAPAKAPGPRAYVVPIGDQARLPGLRVAAQLRAAGIAAEVDLMRRNPGKAFKAAAAQGARFTVVLGEKELERGSAGVKDLETGDQVDVPIDQLARHLAG